MIIKEMKNVKYDHVLASCVVRKMSVEDSA